MAKPRKKYNHNARSIKQGEKILKDCFIAFAHNLGKDGIRFYYKGRNIPHNKMQMMGLPINLIYDFSYYWTIITGVMCRTPNGKEFIDYEEVTTTTRYHYVDLDAFAGKQLRKHVDKNNKEHLLSSFYFAIPNKGTLTEQQMITLLYEMGVDKLNTWYERNIIFKKAMEEISEIEMESYLSKPTYTQLKKVKLLDWGEIRKLGRAGLLEIKGIGKKRSDEIISGLANALIGNLNKLNYYLQFQADETRRNELDEYFAAFNTAPE